MPFEKLKTLIWFAKRPNHWSHMMNLIFRKVRADYDSAELREAATTWARDYAVDVESALSCVGLEPWEVGHSGLEGALLSEAEERVACCPVVMGGPGDLNLIFEAVKRDRARRVLETGVAYGWSSLAILAALDAAGDARLVSVDMPYPKLDNESWVGVAVPDRLRTDWTILREPDRKGLEKAIAEFGGQIDLCHYDSDKSWYGRMYAYPLLWNALAPGGVFISDDIQDNFAFRDFVTVRQVKFAVTEFKGKFVGICRKPDAPLPTPRERIR